MGNMDMGTDTLLGRKDKAAASCRTPNASRLPTPTASAAARGKPSGSAAGSNGAIWGQTRYLGIRTKRQQAAALQTLRACQRPQHQRQRVDNHRDQRRDRMGPYGDRHVVWAQKQSGSKLPHSKRFASANAHCIRGCSSPAFRRI